VPFWGEIILLLREMCGGASKKEGKGVLHGSITLEGEVLLGKHPQGRKFQSVGKNIYKRGVAWGI